jgi:hypothetical protein
MRRWEIPKSERLGEGREARGLIHRRLELRQPDGGRIDPGLWVVQRRMTRVFLGIQGKGDSLTKRGKPKNVNTF